MPRRQQSRGIGLELSTIVTTDELRILAHAEIRRGVWHRKCERNLSAILQQYIIDYLEDVTWINSN